MKRILAALKGKLEEVKLNNKVKRVEAALNSTEINAESEKIELDGKLTELISDLDKCSDINNFISELSAIMSKQEENDKLLERINAIRTYLNEEV